jgi:hypothetical protein
MNWGPNVKVQRGSSLAKLSTRHFDDIGNRSVSRCQHSQLLDRKHSLRLEDPPWLSGLPLFDLGVRP